jgi:ankyrin repeat protein
MTEPRRPDPDPEVATILQRGSPSDLRALLDDGFDVSAFRHNIPYDALMTSVFGRDVFGDANLIETPSILIDAGAPLSGNSSYGESALSVLSHPGRFDGVEILLKAGADASLLQWTPLARAVALGTVEEVRDALSGSDQLEVEDRWSRTPFLTAFARGSSEIAGILADAGADQNAKDHIGRTALFHAADIQ